MVGEVDLSGLLTTDELDIEGSRVDLVRFLSLLQLPDGTFAIVTP
jgi:alkyl sulfatase BDS1-like metallo-beta-lactamase superfamily hydrolase